MKTFKLLTPHQLYELAPAIYASKSGHRTSDQYGFTPTSKILGILEKAGWFPHHASQVRSTKYGATGTHMVRLVQPNTLEATHGSISWHSLGAEPEIIVINDHNGRKKFQIHAGVFRFACANGLVIASSGFDEVIIKHWKDADQTIVDAVQRIQASFRGIGHKILEMRLTRIGPTAQLQFAAAALRYRYGERWKDAPVAPKRLLEARREVDTSDDLWTVLNVVQENIIRGGIKTERRASDGRQRSRFYRGISSTPLGVDMNKRLWEQALWMLEAYNEQV